MVRRRKGGFGCFSFWAVVDVFLCGEGDEMRRLGMFVMWTFALPLWLF